MDLLLAPSVRHSVVRLDTAAIDALAAAMRSARLRGHGTGFRAEGARWRRLSNGC